MTPKDKAKELVGKMALHVNDVLFENAKETAVACALICVDELISQMSGIDSDYSMGVGYWQQVKQEIENL